MIRTLSSLRGRLTIIYLILIIAATAALGIQVYRWTAADLISERRIRLLTEARIVADAVASERGEGAARVLENFARRFDSRILLLNGSWEVQADSLDSSSPETSLVQRRIEVEEVRSALLGEARASVYRLSSGEHVMYATAPVIHAGEITGALLISSSLTPILDSLSALTRRLLLTGLAVTVVFVTATWLIALRLTSPLENLTRAARRLGSGSLDARVRISSRDEVGELAQTFNLMADRLQKHDLAQRRFISDASHELRSPVSSAVLIIDALQVPDETDAALIDRLREQLERMRRLVSQLLELTRLDEWEAEDEGNQEPEYADVSAAVSRIFRRMEPIARAGKVRLQRDVRCSPMVIGPEDDLERILQGLVENAVKYAGPDGTVRVGAQWGEGKDDPLILRVADDGPGIPPDALSHVFDRFYRADPSRSREEGGFGLGLAIVQRRVRAMGGNIEVSSKPGQGACFTVTLPLLSETTSTPGQS
ncbi:MAG: ATP-binding protein [Bacillota bacterium]